MKVSGLILCLVQALIIGCGPVYSRAFPSADIPLPSERPEAGGTLTFWTFPAPHLDPNLTSSIGMHGGAGLAYGYLFRYDTTPGAPNLRLIPSAASSWSQPDDRTYLLQVRSGVRWHNLPPVNGRELTAQDVVYSLDRARTPGWPGEALLRDIAQASVEGERTVRIALREPSAPFLTYLAHGQVKLVAREAVEAGGGTLKNGPTIGTGPFVLEVPSTGSSRAGNVTLQRNPDYWEQDSRGQLLPYLDRLVGLELGDPAARFAAFQTSRIDLLPCAPAECALVQRSRPWPRLVEQPGWSVPQIGLNVRSSFDKLRTNGDSGSSVDGLSPPRVAFGDSTNGGVGSLQPLLDVRVRKAVSKALDRRGFHESQYGRSYEQGSYHFGFVAPDASWLPPQQEFERAWDDDPLEAQRLLKEAGYPNGIDLNFTCANSGSESLSACEFLSSRLGRAGIHAPVKAIAPSAFLSTVIGGQRQFELYYGPQIPLMEVGLWLEAYESNGPRNVSGINDAALDRLILAQRREFDPQRRRQILLAIQRHLLEQYYLLHPRAVIQTTAVRPWVRNYSSAPDFPTPRWLHYAWLSGGRAQR